MPHRLLDNPPPYTPESDRRRRRMPDWLTKDIKPRDVGLGILAILVALGWTFTSPNRRIAAVEARVTANEKAISTLAEQQRFTNYMLCVNARRTDPASAPPDCAPIIEARKAK